MATTDITIRSNATTNVEVDLDSGDPKMFSAYWKRYDNECSVTIKASDIMTYFPNPKEGDYVFQRPEFTDAVRSVHRVVGNAVTEGRYIIGGTGSSQLFILALRALASSMSTRDDKKRIPVVCPEPCYWRYGEQIKEEKSEKFEWCGDANTFKEERGPYIEVVTYPNHPDGLFLKPVVNREGGMLIYDLAYYWPHYSPITAPADFDIMLFTLSKATGHAGSRVGWAIVKDAEIATKIMKQIALLSIGTCQEGQLRATKILKFVADSYDHALAGANNKPTNPNEPTFEGLFEYGHRILASRWEKLIAAVNQTTVLSLPHFPLQYCNYFGKITTATPAFAWLECKTGDATEMMTQLMTRARSGASFISNMSGNYVRVSMLGSDNDAFNLFFERISRLP